LAFFSRDMADFIPCEKTEEEEEEGRRGQLFSVSSLSLEGLSLSLEWEELTFPPPMLIDIELSGLGVGERGR